MLKVKKIFTLFTLITINSISIGQVNETFPKGVACKEIEKSCDIDSSKSCIKRLCGTELDQYNLNILVKNSGILNKKFDNLFNLEEESKKIIKKSFTKYEIRVITQSAFQQEKTHTSTYLFDSRRINVLTINDDKIVEVVIG